MVAVLLHARVHAWHLISHSIAVLVILVRQTNALQQITLRFSRLSAPRLIVMLMMISLVHLPVLVGLTMLSPSAHDNFLRRYLCALLENKRFCIKL
ncbi:hypothetical protein WN943_007015 [Citrus x changshan-huyou]